jgi:RNA polymerase-associated protein
LGIELPKQAKSIYDYKDRVFSRDSFKESLSDLEHELRE